MPIGQTSHCGEVPIGIQAVIEQQATPQQAIRLVEPGEPIPSDEPSRLE